MSDIFISYSREDRGKANDIAEALKKQGFSVWWDRSILPGERFGTVIEEALDAAKCVIVLWSKISVSSDWVEAEASEGKQRGILIPVLIERDVKIPLPFRRTHAADLRDWEGKLPHLGFDNLLKAVAGILGSPRAVQPGREIKADEAGKKQHQEEELLSQVQENIERRAREYEEWEREEHERPKTFTNSIGMKFTLIPAGEFNMGSEEYDSEKPVHKVKINNSFYLGTYLVTQREWKAVMGDNPSSVKGVKLPVEKVSWFEVQEFIFNLNEKEGTDKYRLPNEAEWEYACRAGTTTRYSFGDSESELGDYAWYDENSDGKTHPVGQKKPNSWGLYDMHGNVYEWVQDCWHDSYDGAPTDGSAWERAGNNRVNRGGSWYDLARNRRSASRRYDIPYNCSHVLGFRLLREL